jgi:chromate reductase, NAD(P)H dehydrogenase (quinone)
MSERAKILAFAGSTREASFNKKLVRIAAEGALEGGAEVKHLDLRNYPLPLYDGDLEAEAGIPENGLRLKALLAEHHGILIAAPEYNSSVSAVLKNAIDWISRPEDEEPPAAAFAGKVAGIMSASPGGLGGLRGLVHLRAILENIGTMVLPHQATVAAAHAAFDEDGNLYDPKRQTSVKLIGKRLAEVVRVLNTLPAD